jgi:acyl-coenzyme A synthetase/AMP-(fatty) acid ligase
MENKNAAEKEDNDRSDICISNKDINIKEVEQILLSHESVLEAFVTKTNNVEDHELLKCVIKLKSGYSPSSDLERELAWYVETDTGFSCIFKNIEFIANNPEPPVLKMETIPTEGNEVYISGHRINTSEIEKILESCNEVVHAVVIDVPDQRKGNLLKAFIELKGGCALSNDLKRELAWQVQTEMGFSIIFKDIESVNDLSREEILWRVREEDAKASSEQKGNTQGEMVIVDTLDEDGKGIHVSSHKISTTEITQALLSHPDVLDAAVVTVPNGGNSEVMKGFIRLKEGIVPSNDLKLELARYVMTELKPIVVFKNMELETSEPEIAIEPTVDITGEDVINISDYSILSSAVEKALANHDAVFEAAVIGVPDETHGEALQAFVTLREGIIATESLRDELAWYARTDIGPEVVFKHITFRRYLPRAGTRKTLRSILKADALEIPTQMSITIAD